MSDDLRDFKNAVAKLPDTAIQTALGHEADRWLDGYQARDYWTFDGCG